MTPYKEVGEHLYMVMHVIWNFRLFWKEQVDTFNFKLMLFKLFQNNFIYFHSKLIALACRNAM